MIEVIRIGGSSITFEQGTVFRQSSITISFLSAMENVRSVSVNLQMMLAGTSDCPLIMIM